MYGIDYGNKLCNLSIDYKSHTESPQNTTVHSSSCKRLYNLYNLGSGKWFERANDNAWGHQLSTPSNNWSHGLASRHTMPNHSHKAFTPLVMTQGKDVTLIHQAWMGENH